jgi:hypothetical protein
VSLEHVANIEPFKNGLCKFPQYPTTSKSPPQKSEQLTMSPTPNKPPLPELIPDLLDLTQVQCMELTLAALIASSTKPDGKANLSIQKTAVSYEVPQSMLNDHWNGTPTHKEGHAHELLLTSVQEEVLVEWIKVMGCHGIPMTMTMITDHVANIVGHTVGKS